MDERPSRFEIVLAPLAVCFSLLFSLLDILRHPGAAFPDELSQLQWLQERQEGLALPLSFAKGSLQRLLLLSSNGAYSITLYLPGFVLFAAECWLLYLIGKQLFSRRAGLWAVLVTALASFTFLRLRSLLSYSVFPFEFLLLLYGMLRVRSFWASLGLGFASAAMLLDYEAWIFGLLFLGFLTLQKESPVLKAWLAGLSLGVAAVVWLSKGDLAAYVAVRQSQNLPHGFFDWVQQGFAGLKGYWLGGPTLAYTGVKDCPAFPIWAWPLLLTGIFSLGPKRRWLLAGSAFGFLGLLSRNSSIEPQRAILAWPLLCLVAGVGAVRLLALGRFAWVALLGLACFGAVHEARACIKAMDTNYTAVYGQSASVFQISRQPWDRPVQILTEFDNESSAAWRFMLPMNKKLEPGVPGRRLALLPRPYCLQKNSLKGTWLEVPDNGPCLLEPDPKTWERLSRVDAELGTLWHSLPRFDLRARRRLTLAYYLGHPQADVWVKTACLEQVFGASFLLGEVPLDLLKKVENDDLASASLLLWCSTKLRNYDPAWSLRLLKRAHVLDPSVGLP